MQLTREGDYGVRSVLYLSRQPYKKISFVSEIADMYKIPRSFLAKILQKLVKAGIAKSYRGVKGGFSLARPAKDVTVLDVVEAIEGKMTMNLCLAERKKCDFQKQCPAHHVWAAAQVKFIEVLKKANFDELARQKT